MICSEPRSLVISITACSWPPRAGQARPHSSNTTSDQSWKNGVTVVYLDLWADQRRDPGVLIAEAIGRALEPHLGFVARTAKNAGLENVSLGGWLSIDTSKIGALDGATCPMRSAPCTTPRGRRRPDH